MANLITAQYFNDQMATLGLKATFAVAGAYLDTLITEASDWVEGYCDRKFELQEVTEEIYGPKKGGRRLVADNYPVVSVTSAYWQDDLGYTGSLDVSRMRVLLGGIIEWKTPFAYGSLYSGEWYPNVFYTITYQTGYATIPTNVQRATALKVANLMQPQYQGVQTQDVMMVSNIEALIVDLLEPFRRERLG